MEILMQLLPLIGGGIFGAFVKLKSMEIQNKKEEHQMMLATMSKKAEIISEVNKIAVENKGFSFARRTIAFAVTSIIVIIAILPLFIPSLGINVLTEVQEGGSYLFGLIDTTETKQVWVKLQGAVLIPEVALSFQAIVGAYFGASIASSK